MKDFTSSYLSLWTQRRFFTHLAFSDKYVVFFAHPVLSMAFFIRTVPPFLTFLLDHLWRVLSHSFVGSFRFVSLTLLTCKYISEASPS